MDEKNFRTIGAIGHAKEERQQEDFYATQPEALKELLKEEKFNHNVWECACGKGHLSEVLSQNGYEVKSTDLIDRGYGIGNFNFLQSKEKWNGDIITNPPYSMALDFIKKSLETINDGNKVCMLLKTTFLEGKNRKAFFKENPPKVIYVSSSRINCAKNGDFEKYQSSAISYSWFIWEKGFKGNTVVKWFN